MLPSLFFRLLGPLELCTAKKAIPLPLGRQRTLLAALLVNAHDWVVVDELVDRVWGASPPCRPRPALHTLLTRLRHTLDARDAGLSRLISTSASAYRIEPPEGALDLLQFRELLSRAHVLARRGDWEAERVALSGALALWRGTPLSDVQSDTMERDVVPALTEEWIRAVERHHDVCLHLGRHQEILSALRTMTGRHPYHERLWYQLMVALFRSGRRADALAAYSHMSRLLQEEMGMEPGEDLRRLHLAILRAETASAAHPARPPGPSGSAGPAEGQWDRTGP